MGKAGYSAATGATVASGTALKTVLSVIAPAQFGVDLKKYRVSFDGITATALPILTEIWAFTADGTGTGGTVVQTYGRTITAGFTSKYNYTVEPTGLSLVDSWWLDPNKSTVLYDVPLGDTPDSAVSGGFALRVTAPATVGVRGTLWFERC